jgi:hypothetical protein
MCAVHQSQCVDRRCSLTSATNSTYCQAHLDGTLKRTCTDCDNKCYVRSRCRIEIESSCTPG